MPIFPYIVGAALVVGAIYVGRNIYREYVSKRIVNAVTEDSPQYATENAKFVEERTTDNDDDKKNINENSDGIIAKPKHIRDSESSSENLKKADADQANKKPVNVNENRKILDENSGPGKGNPKSSEGIPGAVKQQNSKTAQETPETVKEKSSITKETPNADKEKPKTVHETQGTVKETPKNIEEIQGAGKEKPRVTQESHGAVNGNSVNTVASKEKPNITHDTQEAVKETAKITEETLGAVKESPKNSEEIPGAVKDKSKITQETSGTVKETPKNKEEIPGGVKDKSKITQETHGTVGNGNPLNSKETSAGDKEKPKITPEKGAAKETSKITGESPGAVKEKPKSSIPEIQGPAKEKPKIIPETPGTVKDDKSINGKSDNDNNKETPKTVDESQENLIKHQEIIEKLKNKIDPESNYLERHFHSDFKKLMPLVEYRDVIAHLQDWTYKDIKGQCSNLGAIGYAAVQLSPVTAYAESDYINNWKNRFHVTSYRFKNELGTKDELKDLIKKCNEHKVKVFVDIVINNMAPATDVDKYERDFKKIIYTYKDGSVLYKADDFHEMCEIGSDHYLKESYDMNSYPFLLSDKSQITVTEDNSKCDSFQKALKILEDVRDVYRAHDDKEGFEETLKLREHIKKEILWSCWLYNFPDLKQVDDKGRPVKQIVNLFRDLIFIGVSGFRVLTADYMNPNHLHEIYEWLPRQNIFIYNDVYDPLRKDAVMAELILKAEQYAEITRVTDYNYARLLSRTFLSRKLSIKQMFQSPKELDLLPSDDSVVFVNNFITMALGNTGIGKQKLEDAFIYPSYPIGDKAYKLAAAFVLINDYGIPLITSSYFYTRSGTKIFFNEHLWPNIKQIIYFRYLLKKHNGGKIPPPSTFTEYGWSQASFCLGTTGFVIFNFQYPEIRFDKTVDTCFDKDGIYCDVFGGSVNTGSNRYYYNKPCMGNSMTVTSNGKKGLIYMASFEGFAAFHIDAIAVTVK